MKWRGPAEFAKRLNEQKIEKKKTWKIDFLEIFNFSKKMKKEN